MSRSITLYEGRNVVRFVLVSVLGIWLSGCSSDSSRLDLTRTDPFTNPFSTASANAPTSSSTVTSQPLPGSSNTAYAVPARPSPVAVANRQTPAPAYTASVEASKAEPVGGSANGWSAMGGTPIIVGQADSLNTLSSRYGVPSSALLSANGLRSASQVQAGMHIVIPVYSSGAKTASAEPAPASADPKKRHGLDAAKADTDPDVDNDTPKSKAKLKAQKTAADDDAETPAKAKDKAKAKLAATDDSSVIGKDKAKVKADAKIADSKPVDPKAEKTKADKAKVADADTPKASTAKTPATKSAPTKFAVVDPTPTAKLSQADAKTPETSAETDAKGGAPEFRWPARGRIIQGYKDSGNDGINISVPEGTSVRAAESGVVAYAGSGLKGYGNLVLIQHPNGYVSAYANNGELNVKRGETVKRGQVIAKSGESGNVTSPQLHFELRDKGGTPVDPTSFLAGI